jgi:hypothetical protein
MKTLISDCAGLLAFLLAAGAMTMLGGCAGAPGWTGGGLPPGPTDIGGVVVADTTPQASSPPTQPPVEGAEILLVHGNREVGRATTGSGGYFRFENPPTGQYKIEVTPPAGSGLDGAKKQFAHVHGKQTFLTIVLHKHGNPHK